MNNRKRTTALVLTVLMCAALLAGCASAGTGAGAAVSPAVSETPSAAASASASAASASTLSVAALKGPTAMGLVKLMSDSDSGRETANSYKFSISASADEITPSLIKGGIDIACVPANLASVLYAKTKGAVDVLAVNTLGILYIVENGNTVNSLADLKGKTIAASGKGATPEYALRYLLSENGIDPDKDVTIDWKNEHSECVTALAGGSDTIALLPQPFVTVAQTKMPDLRVAVDLTKEWDALGNGSSLLTGVVVARKDVIEKNPQAVDAFLKEYAESVDWVNANTADAAQLIGSYDIVDAAVAQKALPYCNIVCMTGSEMKQKLSGYLEVLYEQNAESVGGSVPGDDFYYGA